jgi:hypothetical protein
MKLKEDSLPTAIEKQATQDVQDLMTARWVADMIGVAAALRAFLLGLPGQVHHAHRCFRRLAPSPFRRFAAAPPCSLDQNLALARTH